MSRTRKLIDDLRQVLTNAVEHGPELDVPGVCNRARPLLIQVQDIIVSDHASNLELISMSISAFDNLDRAESAWWNDRAFLPLLRSCLAWVEQLPGPNALSIECEVEGDDSAIIPVSTVREDHLRCLLDVFGDEVVLGKCKYTDAVRFFGDTDDAMFDYTPIITRQQLVEEAEDIGDGEVFRDRLAIFADFLSEINQLNDISEEDEVDDEDYA